MDAATFRWVLVIIALLVALAIYFYGQYQSRLRRRSAADTFTREEIDSAFVEDEQLRTEMNNLNQILRENEDEDDLRDIGINLAAEVQTTPVALPDPEIHLHRAIASRDSASLINYHLRHKDFRLITGEEAFAAMQQTGLEVDEQGLLEYRETGDSGTAGEVAFRIASLSEPGDFLQIENLDFSTLGLNCFIDLDDCENPQQAYESLLKKVDELVRLLNLKVFKPSQELLTISDVTDTRKSLLD
ncbi:MAG TPA: cell division protein ZipA C-terminal FtsZ-binding domain-containing protein [Gammaproteobacteria bacterium]|nr:cell division protein ZipA C-terminal FtsZ-binding domain-containing protein [Gammaproteobacteria bacterium]